VREKIFEKMIPKENGSPRPILIKTSGPRLSIRPRIFFLNRSSVLEIPCDRESRIIADPRTTPP
jgi:hypothetical protein